MADLDLLDSTLINLDQVQYSQNHIGFCPSCGGEIVDTFETGNPDGQPICLKCKTVFMHTSEKRINKKYRFINQS